MRPLFPGRIILATNSILIVGGGPTGLVLALSLARRGISVGLIDDDKGPGEHSRAMAVHARTLEFYRQFGFADEVVAHGVKAETIHLREGGKAGGEGHEVTSFNFKDMGAGISPYPYMLSYPQDDHERFLVDKLKASGIAVEWNAKLIGFSQDSEGVKATIAHGDGRVEETQVDYICGCDGARSQVRQSLGLDFSGGTYSQLFYVTDVKIAAGFERDIFANLGERILALMLPVRSSGMQRLIGLVPPELSEKQGLTFEDIRAQIEALIDVKVTEVNWFSSYRVHHRIAERFHVGRAFLLGDAAHIHSPAGGQGMNTGIGDAVNLGWKLAQVVQGRADKSLLDTYEPERITFARMLIATTDRAFTSLVAPGLRGEMTRRFLVPFVMTIATRLSVSRHALFRTLSQTHIHYEDSALSEGKAGHVNGGDRLPWIGDSGEDNFVPLGSLDWQVHVYGEATNNLIHTCGQLNIPLHVFAWGDGAQHAGLKRDAAYLVRPDGYVAVASSDQNPASLKMIIHICPVDFEAIYV